MKEGECMSKDECDQLDNMRSSRLTCSVGVCCLPRRRKRHRQSSEKSSEDSSVSGSSSSSTGNSSSSSGNSSVSVSSSSSSSRGNSSESTGVSSQNSNANVTSEQLPDVVPEDIVSAEVDEDTLVILSNLNRRHFTDVLVEDEMSCNTILGTCVLDNETMVECPREAGRIVGHCEAGVRSCCVNLDSACEMKNGTCGLTEVN